MPDADLDQATDALMGAAYGPAGERCMAVSVAVPVREGTADALIAKLAPRVRALMPRWARWSHTSTLTACVATSIWALPTARRSWSTAEDLGAGLQERVFPR